VHNLWIAQSPFPPTAPATTAPIIAYLEVGMCQGCSVSNELARLEPSPPHDGSGLHYHRLEPSAFSAPVRCFPVFSGCSPHHRIQGAVQAVERPRAHLLEPGCVFARVLCLRWRKLLHPDTVAPCTGFCSVWGIFYSPRSSVKVSPSTETVRLRSKRRNFQTLPLPYLWA